jgi:hypothetical protein
MMRSILNNTFCIMSSLLLMPCVCGTANNLYIKNEFLDHLINMRSRLFFVIDKLVSQEFTVTSQDGRTPWMGDRAVTRPLPTHRINAHNTDIHALHGVQTHDPSVRASEDSPCLRPHSHCDWHDVHVVYVNICHAGRDKI